MIVTTDYERSILGAILLASDGRVPLKRSLGQGLRSEHFLAPRNRAIFQAMTALTDRDEPIDVLTVLSELQHQRRVKDFSTASDYIHSLPNVVPSVANLASYVTILMEKAAVNRKRTYALALVRAADQEDYEGIADAEKALLSVELPRPKPKLRLAAERKSA